MGDNNDRLTVIPHLTKNMEQLLCFLWSQNRSRLIQDQDICPTIKYLDNLYCLLLGNRHIIDLLTRIYLKSIFITDIFNFFGSFLDIQLAGQSENDIFCRRQHIDQLKMLMYHTNSKLQRILRGFDHYFPSIDKYLSLIRKVNSRKHIHQSCLSTSILSK